MASNKISPAHRTALIMPKEEFRFQLVEQISLGNQLTSRKIVNVPELEVVEKEFEQWDDFNIELLKSAFNKTLNEYRAAYANAGQMIGVEAVYRGASIHNPKHRAATLGERLRVKVAALESLLGKLRLIHSEVENLITKSEQLPMGDTVLIIHGHDEAMKNAVQLFLNRAGLKDVVLHEQPDKNRTVIEKLIEEGANAAYAISLLSPDDVLQDGTVRARQNVILEIGYFIGKIGRERVRILKKGDVEIPSDLSGILYENFDAQGAWKIKLLKEMEAIGLPIDLVTVMKKF